MKKPPALGSPTARKECAKSLPRPDSQHGPVLTNYPGQPHRFNASIHSQRDLHLVFSRIDFFG